MSASEEEEPTAFDVERERIRQEWERLHQAQERFHLEWARRDRESRERGLVAGDGNGDANGNGDDHGDDLDGGENDSLVDRVDGVVGGGTNGADNREQGGAPFRVETEQNAELDPPRVERLAGGGRGRAGDVEVDGDLLWGHLERLAFETRERLGGMEAAMGRMDKLEASMARMMEMLRDRETRARGPSPVAAPRPVPASRSVLGGGLEPIPSSGSEVTFPREAARRAAAAAAAAQVEPRRKRSKEGHRRRSRERRARDASSSSASSVEVEPRVGQFSREERKILTRPVPEFCPEKSSVESFLLAMEQMFAVMGTRRPEAKTSLILRSLGATAMESVMAADMDAHTPPAELCAFLRRRFGAKLGKESAADGLETVRRGEHESIERYADRVALLAKRAEATRATAVRSFLRGVNCVQFVNSMQQMSLAPEAREALTLQRLCDSFEAGRVRGMWPEFPSEEPPQRRVVCEVAGPPVHQFEARAMEMIPAPAQQVWHGAGPVRAQPDHSQEVGPTRGRREPPRKPEKRECYRCGIVGHLVRDCRAPKPTAPVSGNGRR